MMRRIIRRTQSLWRRWFPRPCYVIIYDDPRHETEEYYGYFESPEEARRIWREFTMDYAKDYENVKLCRVVEDWT